MAAAIRTIMAAAVAALALHAAMAADKIVAGPPPPLPPLPSLAFDAAFGSNMVLQQAPAKAAVYGFVGQGGTAVKVTVAGEGTSYTVDAVFNQTNQAFGPQWGVRPCPKEACPPYDMEPFTPWGVPLFTWKALLRPSTAGGNYTITVDCIGCGSNGSSTVSITNVTFGDFWYCSGQSNQWLPVSYSFSRNDTVRAIQGGKYHNVRLMAGGSGSKPYGSWPNKYGDKGGTNPWMTAEQAIADGTFDKPTFSLFKMGAACWYFAQRLSELGVSYPIGIADTAIGGQRIEEYATNESLQVCTNRSGGGKDLWWDAQLWGQQVLPFTDMTVKGFTWYQGENNMGEVKGSAIHNIGYSCEQRQLVEGWRKAWSKTPGTTDPLAPFGIVTLASSGSEGGPNMGAMRQAQTAGLGVLPGPSMPNTFLAQAYDLDDPWGPAEGPCFKTWKCCDKNGHPVVPPPPGPPEPDPHAPVDCNQEWEKDTDYHTGADLGPTPGASPGECCTICANATNLKRGCAFFTWVPAGSRGSVPTCWLKKSDGGRRKVTGAISGSIRKRGPPPPPPPQLCTADKARTCELACSAARDTPIAMGGIHPRDKKPVGDRLGTAAFNTVYGGNAAHTGPTLASCSVGDNQLVVDFNTSLLRGDRVVLQGYEATNSYFEVQTNASAFCMEPQSGNVCPTWAGGDGKPSPVPLDSGWISLNISVLHNGSLAADLSPLNGAAPTAVRYAWGIVSCCNTSDPELYITKPCGPAPCPIMSTSDLPANPFLAKIVGGRCTCVPPQVC
eukprot:m.264243 g.264243  ORF g.264243 m.264243 type:complete len:778 (+) comp19248_c1_seq11:1238-3571(+)